MAEDTHPLNDMRHYSKKIQQHDEAGLSDKKRFVSFGPLTLSTANSIGYE